MPRRQIVRMAEIYARRGSAYIHHYESYQTAKIMIDSGRVKPLDIERILSRLPKPTLEIDGNLSMLMPLAKAIRHEYWITSPLFSLWPEIVCSFYWSPGGWADFLSQYQSLPDVYEDYYYQVDRRNDLFCLVPMSSKLKQGSIRAGYPFIQPVDNSLKSVDKSVDNPVSNSGTNQRFQVQLPKSGKLFAKT